MAKITLAFCKARYNFMDDIIRWWTKSKYTHVELIMPDGDWLSLRHGNMWMKRKSPLKIMAIPRDCINPRIWDTISIEVTEEQLKSIRLFFKETSGAGYDWVGMILSHVMRIKIKLRSMWYCSEWVMQALKIAGILNWKETLKYEMSSVSPGELYTLCKKEKND